MLIGLAGHKRAGKSTAARYICRRYGFVEESFGAPLRLFASALIGCTVEELEEVKERPIGGWLPGWTPRKLMQQLGTEWGRESVHPEIWTRALMHRIRLRGSVDVVISDVRFVNEAQAIRNAGGLVIRLHRDAAHQHDLHQSERPLPSNLVDRQISNDASIEELFDGIDHALIDICERRRGI